MNKNLIKITTGVLALSLLVGCGTKSAETEKETNKETVIDTEVETKVETEKETTKETNKETEKESTKETQKETEVEKETEKENKESKKNKTTTKVEVSVKPDKDTTNNTTKPSTGSTSKPSTGNTSKPSTGNTTKPSKPDDKITTEQESKRDIVSYNTVRKHYISGAKTRVVQQGQNGYKDTFYKVTYKNGVETSRSVVDTYYQNPTDEIIETYVKVQDAKYEEIQKEVDDLDRPVYRRIVRERWFVKYHDTGEIKYFYSAKEAENEYLKTGNTSWGTAEDEVTYSDEIIGYETKIITEKVKVSDEVWEWQ